jgi:hypothetical protein
MVSELFGILASVFGSPDNVPRKRVWQVVLFIVVVAAAGICLALVLQGRLV